MAISVMSDVWALDIQPSGKKFVLFALADSSHDDGSTYFCIDTLAYKTGQSPRAVQHHLSDLIEDGLVERVQRSGRSSLFYVSIDGVRAWAKHPEWLRRQEMKSPRKTPAESAPLQNLHHKTGENSAPAPAESARGGADSAPSSLSLLLPFEEAGKAIPPAQPEDAMPVPRKRATKEKTPPPGSLIFEAYAEAYRARYSADPIRDAKANSNAKAIGASVGVEHGKRIVAKYLQVDGFYERQRHPLSVLLKDIQKFYTWAQTGELPAEQEFRRGTNGPSWGVRNFDPKKANYNEGVSEDGKF